MDNLYLRLTEDKPKWDSPYGHFELRPVWRKSDDTLATMCDLRYEPETNGLYYLHGFKISCQWNKGESDPYAWKAQFDRIEIATVEHAREIAKILGKVQRKLDRLDEKWGRAETFGQFAQRVAMALGCEGFCTMTESSSAVYSWERLRQPHRFWTIAELPKRLSWRIEVLNGD